MDRAGSLAGPLAHVVPGTSLRNGLERIRRAHMGALVVLGNGPDVLEICTGGFYVDVEMTAQRLSELAKMDGAIVLHADASRIAWVNVHLIPDPTEPTRETGTRHRTAERVAHCVDVAVIAVSEETGTITLYRGAERRELGDTDSLVTRANHHLQLLEGFKARYDEAEQELALAERDGTVTLGAVATALQRAEMVVQVATAIGEVVEELGARGRFVELRLGELIVDFFSQRRWLLVDYLGSGPLAPSTLERSLERLRLLSTSDLLDLEQLAAVLEERDEACLEEGRAGRGMRALGRLAPLAAEHAEILAERYGDLETLTGASCEDLASLLGLTSQDGETLLRTARAVAIERARQDERRTAPGQVQ